MRLALEEDDRLTEGIPSLRLDHIARLGRKHVRTRQGFLCRLLSTSYERRHPHSAEPQADSFSREFLRKGLRVSNRKDAIRPFLRDLYDFQEGNHGYDSRTGLTKAYRLRHPAYEVLDAIYGSPDPLPVAREGVRESTDPSANGLPHEVAEQGLHLPSLISVPTEHLDEVVRRIEGWIGPGHHWIPLDPERPGGMGLGTALRIARGCRKWIVSLGGLPNFYRTQSTGRLGPDRDRGSMHVITLPRTIRHLIFHRSGLEDFDLKSCHWSILRSLARAQGVPTPWCDSYVESKEEWHARWAKTTGHRSPKAFKSLCASWLTGGTLSAFPATAGAQAVGADVMAQLAGDRHAQRLHAEVREVLPRVLAATARVEWADEALFTVNAVGRRLELEVPGQRSGRVHAHLLTGFEQFAIRAACRRAEGLMAIVYDGFIAPPQDVGVMEEAIREESLRELGFPLDLRLKREAFSRPIEDREPDPDDF